MVSKNFKITAIILTLLILLIIGAIIYVKKFSSKSVNNEYQNKEILQNSILNLSKRNFSDNSLNFSFEVPESFTAAKIEEEQEGELVLVQNAGQGKGVQIYINQYDGQDALTKDLILSDISGMTVEQEKNIQVDGAAALSFFSKNEDFGQSFEVWFVRGGKLYQLSTYSKDQELVDNIIGSWKWK